MSAVQRVPAAAGVVAQAKEKRASLARESRAAFLRHVIKVERGEPIEIAEIHRLWIRHIEWCWERGKRGADSRYRPGLLCPVRHGKTSIIEGLALYELGKDTSLRIQIVCNDDDNARKRLGVLKEYVEREEDRKGDTSPLHSVFPDCVKAPGESKKSWRSNEIHLDRDEIARDPSVASYSIFSTAQGSTSDFTIFDDVCDEKNTLSNPANRERVKSAFLNTWMTRLEPEARAVYIGTKFHEDDLTADLERNRAWCFVKMGIAEDFNSIDCEINCDEPDHPALKIKGARIERGKIICSVPLFESRWPRERLVAKRQEIGAKEFDRTFRNIVTSKSERQFPNVEKRFDKRISHEDFERSNFRCVSVGLDPASAKRKGSAPGKRCAVAVSGVAQDGHRRLIKMILRRMKLGEIAHCLLAVCETYDPDVVVVESNNFQGAIIEHIEEIMSISPPAMASRWANLIGRIEARFTSGENKFAQEGGIGHLEREIANGLWVFPGAEIEEHGEPCRHGENAARCELCEFYDVMRMAPNSSDDPVMALWLSHHGLLENDPEGSGGEVSPIAVISATRGPGQSGSSSLILASSGGVDSLGGWSSGDSLLF